MMRVRVLAENAPSLRARHFEPMIDVRGGLRRGERREMEPQAHALHELDELLGIQLVVELRLSRQDDAQHLFLGGLDAGQHAYLFEHAVAQILRLVDDQKHFASGDVLFGQELIQGREHLRLLHVERGEAELHQNRLQEGRRRQLGLVDLGDHHVGLELA